MLWTDLEVGDKLKLTDRAYDGFSYFKEMFSNDIFTIVYIQITSNLYIRIHLKLQHINETIIRNFSINGDGSSCDDRTITQMFEIIEVK